MILLGNIIWFVLGGWLLFIVYTIAAIIFFPVFIPIFRIAKYSLFPFEKSIVTPYQLNKYRELKSSSSDSVNDATTNEVSNLLNIVWMLTFGWILALLHFVALVENLLLFFLIITIPNIIGHWKMIRIAFLPFNTVVVLRQIAEDIEVVLAKKKLKI